tara:strand:- start:961 stop:1143 length:183 start_codon:yes stop_codon:yes gene_type:complete
MAFIIWLVVAGLLLAPFKKWVATADAPIISALLWPLMGLLVGLFLLAIPIRCFFRKIKGK